MRYRAYGSERKDAIILLHGGGLSWWNYRAAAERLKDEYRIILPILDGHAGSDRPFTGIRDNAVEIVRFVDEHLKGRALLIGGLSLGAQIVLEVLSQRRDICPFAIVESACAIPSRMMHALIAPTVRMSYGLVQSRKFAHLQFRSLHMNPELFEDYYNDTRRISREDMTAVLQANTLFEPSPGLRDCRADVRIVVGSRERGIMLRSARLLNGMIPNSTLEIRKGLRHGEYSVNHPDAFADELRRMCERGEGA